MKTGLKPLKPLLLIFITSNALFLSGRRWLDDWGTDREIIIWGNVIVFAVTLISYFISIKGLRNTNPHAFVRSIYSGMMLKLFLCIIAAFGYISSAGKDIDKKALFTCMGLYLVYTFVEVSILSNMLKSRKNG